MENALVIGDSGGIGAAVAVALRNRGVVVTGVSRSVDGLDVTDPATIERVLGRIAGPFDVVFVAVGVLGAPEKSVAAIEWSEMEKVFAVNTFGPALLLRHATRLLPKDRRGVFAVLSARVGSIGDNRIGGWHTYRASKAALNQIVHGAAIEMGRTHKQSIVVALHPGTVATAFTSAYAGRHKTVPSDEAAANLLSVLNGLTPAESGGFYDYAGDVVPW